MSLRELYEYLIAEGCKNFYIDGVGGGSGEVNLGFKEGKWQVYSHDRGTITKIYFSTSDVNSAIDYFKDYVLNRIEHWHNVVFTKSNDKLNQMKSNLESKGIRTIQNDTPEYHRLFVVGKDIFKARELFPTLPLKD